MTRDSYQQDLLSIFRMIISPFGRIISVTFTMPIVKLFGNDQAAWIKTMWLWVVIAMALLLFCFLKCEETITTEQKKTVEKILVLTHLKALVKNKYFWCVLVLWTVQVTHMTIIGTSLPYYCKYIFHNDSWMYSVLYFAETIVIILGAMVCPMFIKKWGKRNITLAGAVVAIAAQVCLMLNPNNFYYMFAITLIRSAGVAQLNATVFGMLGDVVEYSYWKNGFRQESMIFGGASLGFKVGSGIASAVITSLMNASGYISSQGADVVQPGSAISMIADIYKWGPVIIWVVAAIMLVIYKLDREMPQIAEELANREILNINGLIQFEDGPFIFGTLKSGGFLFIFSKKFYYIFCYPDNFYYDTQNKKHQYCTLQFPVHRNSHCQENHCNNAKNKPYNRGFVLFFHYIFPFP